MAQLRVVASSLASLVIFAGCATQRAAEPQAQSPEAPAPVAAAPASVAAPVASDTPSVKLPPAAKELEPLAFMTGRWAFPTPNGRLFNREHWMSPMGKAMTGTFQQIRKDGSVAFYEVSTIVAEPDAKDGPVIVTLYHRHLHPKLAIDDKRKNVDVFKLKATGENSATFVPEKDIPGGIESMTYKLDGADKLVQEIVFKPDSKEKTFSTTYVREK
jgi:hypothetical protein